MGKHIYLQKETLKNNKIKSRPNSGLFGSSTNEQVFDINQIFAGVTVWALFRNFSSQCCQINL